ncbi:inaD-like protein isoform X2, partial [Tachysurus ichikawai]
DRLVNLSTAARPFLVPYMVACRALLLLGPLRCPSVAPPAMLCFSRFFPAAPLTSLAMCMFVVYEHVCCGLCCPLQDPLDTTRSVIVIRSLVSGGVAECHGDLLPGDQLVFVNDTYLDTCSLTQAVDALKAVPPGTVYLGIRKPLGAEDGDTVEKPAALKEQEHTTTYSQLPVSKGFRDDSVLPEDIDDDPELILDSTIRYAKPLITPEFLPGEEREMAVDEEEDEEEERNSLRSNRESPLLYHREQSPYREEEVTLNPYLTFTPTEVQQQVRWRI